VINDTFNKQEETRLNKITRGLRSDDGKELIEHLLELHQRISTQLKGNRDPIDIYRNQGKVEALELILKLREEK
jgi:hypothetical protein